MSYLAMTIGLAIIAMLAALVYDRHSRSIPRLAAGLAMSAGLGALVWWYAVVIANRTKLGVFATPLAPDTVVFFYGTAVLSLGSALALRRNELRWVSRAASWIAVLILLSALTFAALHAAGRIHHDSIVEWLEMEWNP